MTHHRSPTHSYPHMSSLSPHATLALRHPHPSIPTLLSPLRSITNTTLLDDFQSNAWVNAPCYRPPLAGLGITCLRDTSTNLHLDPALRTEDERLLPFPLDDPYRGLDSDIDPTASNAVGLIPDVNMYDTLRRLDLPHPGVNPLDTIRNTSFYDIGISYGEPASLTPKVHHIDDIFPTADSRAEQSPSPRVIQDIMSILVQPAPEFSFLPWSSANSPTAQSVSPSQLAAPRSSMSVKLEAPNGEHRDPSNLEYPNIHLSPVLNAHLGIELNELISRAERFRTKYPERDIDRAWLSHFAGKLSDRGELLNDFRCYVIGCDQRNKRRDHILVHVGAHIGQRPFACSMWFVDSRLVVLVCQLNTASPQSAAIPAQERMQKARGQSQRIQAL